MAQDELLKYLKKRENQWVSNKEIERKFGQNGKASARKLFDTWGVLDRKEKGNKVWWGYNMIKKCPVCNSSALVKNEGYGFRCKKCGYEYRKGRIEDARYFKSFNRD